LITKSGLSAPRLSSTWNFPVLLYWNAQYVETSPLPDPAVCLTVLAAIGLTTNNFFQISASFPLKLINFPI
jgi:hypothetical protein